MQDEKMSNNRIPVPILSLRCEEKIAIAECVALPCCFAVKKNFKLIDNSCTFAMESKASEFTGKRMKLAMEEQEKDASMSNISENEQNETDIRGSEEMESNIARLLDKIESFTQLVSELLESGKTIFKDLSNEFEERIIAIHKDHVEKWQHEIKELRSLDSSNEETSTILCNARNLLQNGHIQF